MPAPEQAAEQADLIRAGAAAAQAAALAGIGLAAAGWSRYLAALLGGSDPAAQAVFFAAVAAAAAAGFAFASRIERLTGNPLIAAAAACGFAALGLAYFGDAALAVQAALADAGAGSAARTAAFSALALPPTFLAAGACGLLASWARAAAGSQAAAAGSLAPLALGAAAGAAGGAALVWLGGLPATMLAAAVVLAAVGLAAWIAHHRIVLPPQLDAAVPAGARKPLLLIAAAFAGFALAASLPLWLRVFSLAFGPGWPVAAVAVAAAFACMAIGALLSMRMRALPAGVVARRSLLLMGIALLAAMAWLEPMVTAAATVRWQGWQLDEAFRIGLYAATAGGIELLFVLVPAACAGACIAACLPGWPAAADEAESARPAGEDALACALAGAAIGLPLGALVLLPLAGLWAGQAAVAAFALTAGLAHERKHLVDGGVLAAAAVAAALIHAAPQPQAVGAGHYLSGVAPTQPLHGGTIEAPFYAEGRNGSVAVLAGSELRSLTVNGSGSGLVRGYFAQELDSNVHQSEVADALAGLLPLLRTPDARIAAVAGFGSGLVPAALLHRRSLEAVHTVEPEARVVEAAAAMGPLVARTLRDARSVIHRGQPAAFFDAQPPGSIDIIVVNYDSPWVAGQAGYFAAEHFARMRRALAEDGYLVQRLDMSRVGPLSAAMAFTALAEQFPVYEAYAIGDSLLVVAGGSAGRTAGNLLAEDAEIAQLAARVGIAHADDLPSLKIGSSLLLAPLFASYRQPANSDLFPALERQAVRDLAVAEQLAFRDMRDKFNWVVNNDVLPGAELLPRVAGRDEASRGLGRRFLALQALEAEGTEHLAGALDHVARSVGENRLSELPAACAAGDSEALAGFTYGLQERLARVEPFLRPEENVRLLRSLDAALPCYAAAAADPAMAPLYRFWQAYAGQDYRAAYEIGRGLVSNSLALTYMEQQLLLKVMLAAYAAGEDLQVAVLSRHMTPASPPGLQLAARLVAAHALGRYGEAAGAAGSG